MRVYKICLTIALCFIMIVIKGEISILDVQPNTGAFCDGSITFRAEGTGGPFTVNLMYGSNSYVKTGINGVDAFTGLCNGNYTMEVYSEKTCVQEFSIFVPQGECGIDIQLDNIQNVGSCADSECMQGAGCSNDGSIEVTIKYNGSYDLLWETPYNQTFTDEDIYNLASGNYKLIVQDADNPECSVSREFYVDMCARLIYNERTGICEPETIPDIINVELVDIKPSSNDGPCSGVIEVDISGIGNNSYYWLDQYGNQIFDNLLTGLCPGEYCLTIVRGCEEDIQYCYEIGVCASNLDFYPLLGDECAVNSNDGWIHIIGNESYSYLWDTGDTGLRINDLSIGDYTVTITDNNTGCKHIETFSLGYTEPVEIFNIQTTKSCSSNGTGSITLENRGGTGLTFAGWNDLDLFSQVQNRDNLLPGEYTYIMQNHCEKIEETVFIEAYEINVEEEFSLFCNNQNSITLSVSGDNPPFTYNWSNGSDQKDLINIDYGKYQVTITDNTGCFKEIVYEVTGVEVLEIIDACRGLQDGEITFKVNNPDLYSIDIDYGIYTGTDNAPFPLINGNSDEEVIVNLQGLAGDQEYSFNIQITKPDGSCTIPFTFYIPEERFERVYSRYNMNEEPEVYYCIWDQDVKVRPLKNQL